ncbi:MAG: ParB N-terminal domain-containing protein, partial [Oscillospiraceae bacterium]
LSNLKPLADSILMDGLQQPIIVTASPDDAEKVMILSGHRRYAAIKMLVEDETEPRTELRLVPCIRKTYESSAMAELQLILANSTTRVLTSPEISKQAERTEALLYKLKEEGYSFPGRMRDQVAEACNVSASKLARLKMIRENLCSEAIIAFESGELCEA